MKLENLQPTWHKSTSIHEATSWRPCPWAIAESATCLCTLHYKWYFDQTHLIIRKSLSPSWGTFSPPFWLTLLVFAASLWCSGFLHDSILCTHFSVLRGYFFKCHLESPVILSSGQWQVDVSLMTNWMERGQLMVMLKTWTFKSMTKYQNICF